MKSVKLNFDVLMNLLYVFVLPILLAISLEGQYPKLGWNIHLDYYAAVAQILVIIFIGFYIESSLFRKVRKAGVKIPLVPNFVFLTILNEAVCLFVLATHHSSTFTFSLSAFLLALLVIILVVYHSQDFLYAVETKIEVDKLLKKQH